MTYQVVALDRQGMLLFGRQRSPADLEGLVLNLEGFARVREAGK